MLLMFYPFQSELNDLWNMKKANNPNAPYNSFREFYDEPDVKMRIWDQVELYEVYAK